MNINNDEYFRKLLLFARKKMGSYRLVAKAINKPGQDPTRAVEAWRRNGVAFKWRQALHDKFGNDFKNK